METMLLVFIVLIFFVIYKVNKWALKDFDKSSAGRWLKNYQDESRRDLENFRVREKRKKELLKEADVLQAQSKYGSGWERKELKRQAKDLRDKAGRL